MDMYNLKNLLKDLSLEQLESLTAYIHEVVLTKQSPNTSNENSAYNKPSCPNCESKYFVKNGNVLGKQRFLCKSCKKTFGHKTNTITSHSKLTDDQWKKYIECMIQGFSIRKSAEIADVCVKTSFYMRHKILDAINEHMERSNLDGGVAELDETFLALSFKGNHKKSGFEMPRQSRKRGKQIKKRGISSEQVCIGTGIDNNGSVIMEMACTGRITGEKLEKLFDGYIDEGSIIITDSLSSYESLAKSLKLRHKSIPSGQHADGGFSLSCINSLHSRFKGWMNGFNGVSTKHLNNYLVWFKFLEGIKSLKEVVKSDKMWIDASVKQVDVKIDAIRKREPVWV